MRTFSTSQVVRLLELHPDWEFTYPVKDDCRPVRAWSRFGVFLFERKVDGEWVMIAPTQHANWTRVKPAKAKLERVVVGSVIQGVGGGSVSYDRDALSGLANGTWTLYAVKDGGK